MPNYRVELAGGEEIPVRAHRVIGDGEKIHFQRRLGAQWYVVQAFAVGQVRCIRQRFVEEDRSVLWASIAHGAINGDVDARARRLS